MKMINPLSKRLLRLLGSISAVAVLACMPVNAGAASLKLMFQGDPYEIEAISGSVKRFEATNPGSTVELINVPHDAYNEKFGAIGLTETEESEDGFHLTPACASLAHAQRYFLHSRRDRPATT